MSKRLFIFAAGIGFIVPAYAVAQSFDCRTNRGAAEQTICAYDDLRDLDNEMARLYFSIANDSTGRYYSRLRNGQREWLQNRDDCGANARCLRRLYNDRIEEFREILGGE